MSFQTKKTMQKKIIFSTLLFTIALSGCKEKAKDHNHSASVTKDESETGEMTAMVDSLNAADTNNEMIAMPNGMSPVNEEKEDDIKNMMIPAASTAALMDMSDQKSNQPLVM